MAPLSPLFYTYTLIAFCAIIAIMAVGFGIAINNLTKRLKKLTTGTNSHSLEEAIYQLMDDHKIFEGRIERGEEMMARMDSELKSAVRGIATVRYNAFSDVGGKQSFATALISENGTGAVISSIYTRDRMNVYAKPINNFSSEYELSTEEARALKEATKIFN